MRSPGSPKPKTQPLPAEPMRTLHFIRDATRPSGYRPVEVEASTPPQPAFTEFERDPSRPSGYRPKASPSSKLKTVVSSGLEWLAASVNRRTQPASPKQARCSDRLGYYRARGNDAERLHRAFSVALVESGAYPVEALNHQDR